MEQEMPKHSTLNPTARPFYPQTSSMRGGGPSHYSRGRGDRGRPRGGRGGGPSRGGNGSGGRQGFTVPDHLRVRATGITQPLVCAVFLGPPACGKGTQGTILNREFGVDHISSGDILRSGSLGVTLADIPTRGAEVQQRVWDHILQRILDNCRVTEERPIPPGFVLDGCIRTVEEAQCLSAFLSLHGLALTKVVFFEITADVLVRRAQGRWVHLPSGRSYHQDFNPPRVVGVDDVTGEPLTQRWMDTTEDSMQTRIEIYNSRSRFLRAHFTAQEGLSASVDASRTVTEVAATLQEILGLTPH